MRNWYRPFARQEEFHRSKKKYRLFGGAAGPGKSKALLAEAIGQALEVAGKDNLLFRRDFPGVGISLLTFFLRGGSSQPYFAFKRTEKFVAWDKRARQTGLG